MLRLIFRDKFRGVELMEYAITRACTRKSFKHPVSFELGASEKTLHDVKREGICVDISACGLGVETVHEVPNGAVLKFHIPVRELEITIPVFAQVMWSKPTDDHFRMGLRFLA